jgi:uncharacterized protein (TIGR02452 family)
MRRSTRAQVGKETVEIAERGWYETPAGNRVDITAAMSRCLQTTTLFRPEELDQLLRHTTPSSAGRTTEFEVTNETTLSAARRLVRERGYTRTLCLNFASAKNPGGGFLGGSQAQEESLARSSGLYRSLQTQWTYYEANRECDTALYTDHMILSPNVPVFRDDSGQLFDEPYALSMLTAPAANAGAIRDNEPHRIAQLATTMANRIAKILGIAARNDYEHLILGAWGCGVFRNDPDEVAGLFTSALLEDDRFRNRFRTIVFAVLDSTADESVIESFRRRFAEVPNIEARAK